MSGSVLATPGAETQQPGERPTVDRLEPRKKKKPIGAYLLLSPAILIILAALGYPLYWMLTNAFKGYGLAQQFGQPAEWVGFDNFVHILTVGSGGVTLWEVVIRSIAFCFVTASVTVIIGMLLALLMTAVSTWVKYVLQIALLLAWAMPVVAAMRVWMWMFESSRGGVINYVLAEMASWNFLGWHPFGAFAGFNNNPGHNWLAPAGASDLELQLSFYFVACVIITWMSVPFVAFSLYAGLTQISDEILEAAEIDGASGWKRFWGVIFPMIAPVLNIVILLQIIWDLRVFTQINILQSQIPAKKNTTHLIGTYIYDLGVGKTQYGMAAAASIIVLFITVIIALPYVRKLLKEDQQ